MDPIQALENELVNFPSRVLVITGAGVARATDRSPCSTWTGLLDHGLSYCKSWCQTLSPRWFDNTRALIDEGTTDGLVDAASRIEKALRAVQSGRYDQWLAESVGRLGVREGRVAQAILGWGVRVATLNYDNLLEEASGLQPITWDQGGLALRFLRGEADGILHLHGHYTRPDTVVFGASTYADVCRDPTAQNYLRSSLSLGTVVFVGCGGTFDDPNFSGLWSFCREALRGCPHTHFHLARASESAVLAGRFDGLPVTPVPYGNDFGELGPFLEGIASRVRRRRRPPDFLDDLRRSQGDYQSRMDDLVRRRAEVPASEVVRGTFDLARELWRVGGRRTAALAMHHSVRRAGDDLPADEFYAFGLEAADRLLDDGLEWHAARCLEAITSRLARQPASDAALAQLRLLTARALSTRVVLDEAVRAIENAIPHTPPSDRRRLEAELAELHLLDGNLDGADRAATTEGDR